MIYDPCTARNSFGRLKYLSKSAFSYDVSVEI
jgi:hypothetical protein